MVLYYHEPKPIEYYININNITHIQFVNGDITSLTDNYNDIYEKKDISSNIYIHHYILTADYYDFQNRKFKPWHRVVFVRFVRF